MAALADNRYGKQGIRLVKVEEGPEGVVLRDLTVDVTLEGAFQAAHLEGDNREVLPTDTMKNTVYALAGGAELGQPEELGRALADHFVEGVPAAERARIELAEERWERIVVEGAPHPHAFRLSGLERRRAVVVRDEEGTRVEAGVEDLWVLKTTGSAFAGFLRDRYTTLAEAEDRLLATVIDASWTYGSAAEDFGALWEGVRRTLLESFATHDESRSVQHTAYVMGEAVLAAHPPVVRVSLTLPNKHHLPVDLTPFGIEDPQPVFAAVDLPYGLIEATVER